MEKGNTYTAKCLTCNSTNTYQINDIYAKASRPLSIIAGLIFIIGTLFGLFAIAIMFVEQKTVIGIFVVGCGLLIPVWIFSTIKKEDRLRVKTFNHSYVKEKKRRNG
ncbi:hypothetical protein [Mariniflexile sp. HMF6888]|uniref:hypothetical protein n=1 Tax=Mariniflexile sp. HMF6888 TaxID=3373086 RepID=UPI00378A1B0A